VHPDMQAQIVVLAQETTAAPAPAPQPAVQEQVPVATTTTTTAPAPTTTSSAVAVAEPERPQSPALPPMLLLAGLVAAVTKLCLLLIGSRPEGRKVGEGTEPA